MTWSSLAFPAAAVGTTATSPVVVTLWNTGTASVPVTGITSSNVGEFPWTTTCQLAGSLAAGASCTVTAQFKPNAIGARTATLTINANSTSPALSLTGAGAPNVRAQLAVSPASGDATTTFTLSVTGATPLGSLQLQTVYNPAPGAPTVSFTPTLWTADTSGNLTATTTANVRGSYEVWFIDSGNGLATNHILYTVN